MCSGLSICPHLCTYLYCVCVCVCEHARLSTCVSSWLFGTAGDLELSTDDEGKWDTWSPSVTITHTYAPLSACPTCSQTTETHTHTCFILYEWKWFTFLEIYSLIIYINSILNVDKRVIVVVLRDSSYDSKQWGNAFTFTHKLHTYCISACF